MCSCFTFLKLPIIIIICRSKLQLFNILHHRIVTTLFLFVIRAFVTGVFQAVYVYTPEVYPTNIRARALGTHSAISRIGAFSSPYNAQVWVVCCI